MYWFFDLDGTLMDIDLAERNAASKFYEVHGVLSSFSAAQFVENWRSLSEEYMTKYLAGKIGHQEQRRVRLKKLLDKQLLSNRELDVLHKEFQVYYRDCWTLFEDVQVILPKFRGRGFGIITNGNRAQQLLKVEVLGLGDFVNLVVTPEDAGVAKPDLGIFSYAVALSGYLPSQIIFVGDDPEADMRGASEAGMNPIFVDRCGSCKSPGVLTVTSLEQLVTSGLI